MKKLLETIKWCFFVVLKTVSELRKKTTHPSNKCFPVIYGNFESSKRTLWLFCSTIGELNACKPLLEQLASEYQFLIITDRYCYSDAYRSLFPESVVAEIGGTLHETANLIKLYPPVALLILEIPLLPYDAPCRLSYAFLRTIKIKANCPVAAVNGWLYGYETSARIDSLERRLFSKEYLEAFDLVAVQTEVVREKLIEAGCHQVSIHVTGNMKFDSLANTTVQVKDPISMALIDRLAQSENRIFVAGCIVDLEEFNMVLYGYLEAKRSLQNLQLIIAPRHPENRTLMQEVNEVISALDVRAVFKTQVQKDAVFDIMVLDTIGELRGYYSIATVAYMGRNHNLLEPLAFLKPVITQTDWEPTYPSFSIYEILKNEKIIYEISDQFELAKSLSKLALEPLEMARTTEQILGGHIGAMIKNFQLINPLLQK